jgi:hypothetical protein
VLALGLPERFEDEPVVDQGADGAGELAVQGVVQAVGVVDGEQAGEEGVGLDALAVFEAELAGVGGVEGDPEEQEAGVGVVDFLLGAGEPADGAGGCGCAGVRAGRRAGRGGGP